jgi:hypothetical protein
MGHAVFHLSVIQLFFAPLTPSAIVTKQRGNAHI